MERLPAETLERVLGSPAVTYRDLLALASVSSRFRTVAGSPELWRLKFQQRFGRLFTKLAASQLEPAGRSRAVPWREELRRRLETGRLVAEEVAAMSPRLFLHTELSFSDYRWFDDLLGQHNPERSFVPLHVVDALLELQAGRDLTAAYYAARALSHVQHRLLRGRLGDGWPGPAGHEEAVVVVAQWCQPGLDLLPGEVDQRLGELACRVLARLQDSAPNLPLCRRAREEGGLPAEPPGETLWSPADCRAILEAANHVLYSVEGLAGNTADYYNPANSYINRVLDTCRGIPITLCLLYRSVLLRLGLILAPISFPGHFLLRWLAQPEVPGRDRFLYIDAFDGGKQLSHGEVRQRVPHLAEEAAATEEAAPGECVARMLRNLISIGASRSNSLRDVGYTLLRNALELMLAVSSADTMEYAFMLARIYLNLNINHDEVLSLLAEQRDNPGLADQVPSRRPLQADQQVEYLTHQCQLQLEERGREGRPREPKRRGAAGLFPHGPVWSAVQ